MIKKMLLFLLIIIFGICSFILGKESVQPVIINNEVFKETKFYALPPETTMKEICQVFIDDIWEKEIKKASYNKGFDKGFDEGYKRAEGIL